MSLPVAKLEHCAFGCFGYPCFSQLFKRAGIAANAAAGDGKNDLQCDYGGVLSSNSYYTLQTLEMLFVLKGCIGFVSKLLIVLVLERLRQNTNVGNHWTVFQPAIPRVKVLFLPTFVVSTSWAACPGNPVQSALGLVSSRKAFDDLLPTLFHREANEGFRQIENSHQMSFFPNLATCVSVPCLSLAGLLVS